MPQILPYLLCSALYAVVAVVLARAMSRPDWNAWPRRSALHFATALPLALHTALVYGSVFAGGQMYLGVGNSVSVIIWLTVLIYWAGSFFQRLEGLQIFINAAAALLVWAPLVLPSVHPLSHTDLPAFRAHLLISLLAYSLFTIASLQALMLAILENRLHGGRLPTYLHSLPPLLTIERLLFRIIAAGFVLLTLTLVSGMLFSEVLVGQPLKFNHKVVFGILSWCIYAALLAGRRVYGWRGRLALRWTLAGFLALLLAYVGSKFVVEVILHR
jgi:ABC-type uncharacterized transport system permease subunit